MKKITNLCLAILAVALFAGTMALNLGSDKFLNLKLSDAYATAEVKCFTRTTSACPEAGGVGGGDRVTCDTTGDYKAGESCTPVKCVWGAQDQIMCSAPPVEP